MPAFLMLAAALSVRSTPALLGIAMTDAELAYIAPGAVAQTAPASLSREFPTRLSTWEQIDCWWAHDGAAMIADAVHPTLARPADFDAASIQRLTSALRFSVEVKALSGS